MTAWFRKVLKFDNGRETAGQWIKASRYLLV